MCVGARARTSEHFLLHFHARQIGCRSAPPPTLTRAGSPETGRCSPRPTYLIETRTRISASLAAGRGRVCPYNWFHLRLLSKPLNADSNSAKPAKMSAKVRKHTDTVGVEEFVHACDQNPPHEDERLVLRRNKEVMRKTQAAGGSAEPRPSAQVERKVVNLPSRSSCSSHSPSRSITERGRRSPAESCRCCRYWCWWC